MDISIIIVNYRSQKHLVRCVTSIHRRVFLRLRGEIIIVNNDSREDLGDLAGKYNIQLINNSENFGFGRACNLGAARAKGEVLFFLNPDTEISSGNIEAIIQKMPENVIVGPRLVDKLGRTHRWTAGKKINLYDLARNNMQIPRSRRIWASKSQKKVDWVSGAALVIKKEIFDKLEGFDEKFFMYFEDIDLCRRAKKIGCKILFFPDFSVFHHGGESYDSLEEQKKHYFSSQEHYFKKHCGPVQTALLRLMKKIFI